jgi:hypothetical protein
MIGFQKSRGSQQLLLLVTCGFAFASKIMAAKAALAVGLFPFQLGILRNLGAVLILLLLTKVSGEKIPKNREALSCFMWCARW